MPGCKNNCMFYFETYGSDAIDSVDQDEVLQAMENLEKGEDFNAATLFKIVRVRCLIQELKNEEISKTKCKQYIENLNVLDTKDILKFAFEHKKSIKDNKWKRITFIVTIIGLISTAIFAYLSYTKPTEKELRDQIEIQTRRLDQKDSLIIDLNKNIEKIMGEQKDDQE